MRFLHILALLLLSAPALAARPQYDVDYLIGFLPESGQAEVTITVTPDEARASRLDFRMPAARYTDVEGDGGIERKGDRVVWTPPQDGGEFRFRYRIDHERASGYDARITEDWVIARGDDLVPPAKVRATRGSDSRARLRFDLPEGWTNVDTQYKLARDRESFVVVNPERRFDRPTGWMIAGKVGTRRETIEGTEVSVAVPRGEVYARLEVMGFIHAVAPELERLGQLPTKLLIVGAGDPMWRGGLSATRSLWLHAERKMISGNGTSPLLHELFHVVTRIRGRDRDDWIAEGLAEYYSIELLHRIALLSDERRDKAIEWMREHGRRIKSLRSENSSGPRTARAVALMADLDAEIRERSDEEKSLDDVVRRLVKIRDVTWPEFEDAVEDVLGGASRTLDTPVLR